MRVTIELDSDDIQRFEAALARARRLATTMDEVDVIAIARGALQLLPLHSAPSYVRRQFDSTARLIAMLEDEAWALPLPWREDVLVTLIYISDPEDLIPDDAEVIGLLDDAIMLELLLRRQAPAIRAYERFCTFRTQLRPGRGSVARTLAAGTLARQRVSLQRRMAQPAPVAFAAGKKLRRKPGLRKAAPARRTPGAAAARKRDGASPTTRTGKSTRSKASQPRR
jgi:uncharacterized membrane protein YkvA (DUF1232 family)